MNSPINLGLLLKIQETEYRQIILKQLPGMGRLNGFTGFLLITLTAFFLTVFLSSCTSTYAPVEQRGSKYSSKNYHNGPLPYYYTVRKGDTLYSTAWKYGLDYKQIAYNNHIKSPYRIYSGQKLRIRPAYSGHTASSYKKTARTSSSGSSKKYVSKGSTKSSSKTKVSGSSGRHNSSSKYKQKSSSKKTITSTKTRSSKKNTGSRVKRGSTTKAVSKNKTAAFKGNRRLKWIWPVKGKIIQRYSPGSGKKGIDISAPKGTLIKSAEAGKVVYSGQGLVGYGRLVIIKHNDTYLSAYAHNQQLLVNEGQLVKKGQNIAHLGRSGTNRYKLHFEIRKNGKPVNPISYLPNH